MLLNDFEKKKSSFVDPKSIRCVWNIRASNKKKINKNKTISMVRNTFTHLILYFLFQFSFLDRQTAWHFENAWTKLIWSYIKVSKRRTRMKRIGSETEKNKNTKIQWKIIIQTVYYSVTELQLFRLWLIFSFSLSFFLFYCKFCLRFCFCGARLFCSK